MLVFHYSSGSLILLLYIDDMLLTGSDFQLLSFFIQLLHTEFAMKGLGPLHHFLGIEVTTTPDGLHLSQSHCALTILERAEMVDCKPMSTLLEAKTKSLHNKTPLEDSTSNRAIVGALQYFTLTCHD